MRQHPCIHVIRSEGACSIYRMTQWALIAKGVAAQWAALSIRSVLALVLVPFLLGALGTSAYGPIALVSTVVGLSLLADLGLRQALSRELAEHHVRGEHEMSSVVTSTGFVIFAFLVLVIISALIFAGRPVLRMIGLAGDALVVGEHLLRWFALPSVLLSLLTPAFAANLISINRYEQEICRSHLVQKRIVCLFIH